MREKCYKEIKTKPTSYYCENNDKLNGVKCGIKEKEPAVKEKLCPNGYTKILVDGPKCLNFNKIANKESGFVCEGKYTKLKGNQCIIYDAVVAKKK